MDFLDIMDNDDGSEVDSEEEQEDSGLSSSLDFGITKVQLEENYEMLGSEAPREESSILLSELRLKHPQVH